MMKGYTIKLYPNEEQKVLLEKHFGCTRWVYNEMININQKVYHRTGKSMSGYDMQSMLPKLKKQYPWLAEVNAQSLQIVCHNLADAYKRFFKKTSRYPKRRKKTGSGSFSCINSAYFLEGEFIRLPKLGRMKYRAGEKPSGRVIKFTVKKDAGNYYAAATIECDEPKPLMRTPDCFTGLDLGLNDIVVTSKDEHFKAPKLFKKTAAKLKKAQKNLARCQRGSKRRQRVRLRVAKIYQKIRNQRKDFNHKLTRSLVANNENQAFAIENLNVKGMMANRNLSAAIADVSWGQFISFLKYKSANSGKQVIEVGRFFPSSKTCSNCGVVRDSLPLSVRLWTCGDCGQEHDRDTNAAINIAKEAARNAVSGDGVIPSVLREVSICEASSPERHSDTQGDDE